MKTCSKCSDSLDESQFVKSPRYKDGLYPSCKTCRKAVKIASLAKNPMCSRCGSEPHLGYIPYCHACNLIAKGRKTPTRIVDRTNTTMCCRCKAEPRLDHHNYCRECKNEATAEWEQGNGGSWARLDEEGKNKARARRAVNHRVQRGTMRKEPCVICGNESDEMHHHKGYDGENAFDVQWMCIEHHKKVHKK